MDIKKENEKAPYGEPPPTSDEPPSPDIYPPGISGFPTSSLVYTPTICSNFDALAESFSDDPLPTNANAIFLNCYLVVSKLLLKRS